MNALVDRGSRLLQDEVFLATEYIERADGGGQKLISKYECARSVDCTGHIELPGEMPAAGDKRNNRVLLAFHNNEIEWIAVAGTFRICCAADLLCKCRAH